MESLGIKCPIHTSELIQRVDGQPYTKKTLFCLECITQSGDSNTLLKSLQTIPTFIQNASAFYTQNRTIFQEASETPSQYSNLLSNKAEDLEKLTKHIKNEKKKVETIFDEITAAMLQQLQQKKNKYLNFFDEQLASLTRLYIFLEKSLKRTFPKPEEFDCLYPSKEDLEKRFAQVTTAAQFKSFVEGIKEDIRQAEIFDKFKERPDLKTLYLEESSKKFGEVKNLRPSVATKNLNIQGINIRLQETLDKILEYVLQIKDTIPTPNIYVSLENFANEELAKPSAGLKKIRLACSDYGQQGWGIISHRLYDKDKRDDYSTYAALHRDYVQTLRFMKVGSYYKIVLVDNETQNNWILTCHRHYNDDKRDNASSLVFLHRDEHQGHLWSFKQEGKYFKIMQADNTCNEYGWYLTAHRHYGRDKRDAESTYLCLHKNSLEGQLWELEPVFIFEKLVL